MLAEGSGGPCPPPPRQVTPWISGLQGRSHFVLGRDVMGRWCGKNYRSFWLVTWVRILPGVADILPWASFPRSPLCLPPS